MDQVSRLRAGALEVLNLQMKTFICLIRKLLFTGACM